MCERVLRRPKQDLALYEKYKKCPISSGFSALWGMIRKEYLVHLVQHKHNKSAAVPYDGYCSSFWLCST